MIKSKVTMKDLIKGVAFPISLEIFKQAKEDSKFTHIIMIKIISY